MRLRQFDLAVEVGGHAVNGTDEGTAASTDHSHAEFTFEHCIIGYELE